jgi:hypothetical protein
VEASERPSAASAERGGWHAVKFNRCSGEALVFSTRDHNISEKNTWYKLAVK